MSELETTELPIRSNEDIVVVRQSTRNWAVKIGFSLVDTTRIVTAASEIARNTLEYGGGGTVRIESVTAAAKRGLRLVFEDHGPGIADIAQAMTDGFTTGHGLGLGLSGTKRLMHEFDLQSTPGTGTRITITRWK